MKSLEEQIKRKFQDWGRNSRDNVRTYFRVIKREDGQQGYDSSTVDRKLRLLVQQGYLYPVNDKWDRLPDNNNQFIWGYVSTKKPDKKPKKTLVLQNSLF